MAIAMANPLSRIGERFNNVKEKLDKAGKKVKVVKEKLVSVVTSKPAKITGGIATGALLVWGVAELVKNIKNNKDDKQNFSYVEETDTTSTEKALNEKADTTEKAIHFNEADSTYVEADSANKIFDIENMVVDGNPLKMVNGKIVCQSCNALFMHDFNAKVPAYAKEDLMTYQTKLKEEGLSEEEITKYMGDGMILQAKAYEVDIKRGIGDKSTAKENDDGSLTVSSDGGDSNFSKGKWIKFEGEYHVSGTGGDDLYYNNPTSATAKEFTTYYAFGSKPTTALYTTTETTTTTADVNSHKYLNINNTTYQKNYNEAGKLFRAGASTICVDLAEDGKDKLSRNDDKVDLVTTYYDYTDAPQTWTVKQKKDYLIVRYGAKWNNKSTGEINTKFAKLMKDAKTFIMTGNVKALKMPVTKEDAKKIEKMNNTKTTDLM